MSFSHITFPMYVDRDFSSTWSSSLFLCIVVIGVKHTYYLSYVCNECVRSHAVMPLVSFLVQPCVYTLETWATRLQADCQGGHQAPLRWWPVWPLCWSPRAHNPLPPPGRRASKLTTWVGTRHLGADDLGGQRAEVRAHNPLAPPGQRASELATWVGIKHESKPQHVIRLDPITHEYSRFS